MFAAIEKNVQIKFILPGQSFRLLRSDLAECAVLSPLLTQTFSFCSSVALFKKSMSCLVDFVLQRSLFKNSTDCNSMEEWFATSWVGLGSQTCIQTTYGYMYNIFTNCPFFLVQMSYKETLHS